MIHDVKIPLPPLSEQCAIAEVLGTLDDKIESNDRIVRTSSDLAAAQFRIATDGGTGLADVASVTMGQSPPGSSYNELRDGLPFYQGTRDFGFRHPRRRVWCNAPTRFAEATDSWLVFGHLLAMSTWHRSPVRSDEDWQYNCPFQVCSTKLSPLNHGCGHPLNPKEPCSALSTKPSWQPYDFLGRAQHDK